MYDKSYNEYITEMEIEGENISPVANYQFKTRGNHTVYIKINTENLVSFDKLFYHISKLISITFSEKLNTENITSMERMFVSCSQLLFVDMSHLNVENIKSFDYFINFSVHFILNFIY